MLAAADGCGERCVGGEGLYAGGHFVEDEAERIDVCGRAGFAAFELFRGHVAGCAGHEQGFLNAVRRAFFVWCRYEGEAEVHDDDLLSAGVRNEHDIAGFEVAVNDAGLVDATQSAAELFGEKTDFGDGHRAVLLDMVVEGDALQQLHGQESDGHRPVRAAAREVELVDAADVGAGDLAGEKNFGFEAGECVGVSGDFRTKCFEGDAALLQLKIDGFVDVTHASGTQVPDDAKAAGEERSRLEDGVAQGPEERKVGEG